MSEIKTAGRKRFCKICASVIERPRYSGGRLQDFSQFSKRETCSPPCARELGARTKKRENAIERRKTRPPCAVCGKPILSRRYTKKQIYCSSKCFGATLILPVDPDREDKHAGRTQCFSMYRTKGKVCERCGSNTSLERHHKDRNPRNNAPANIELLCHPCHVAHHIAEGTWGWGGVVRRAATA